jgi:hypothetical protein
LFKSQTHGRSLCFDDLVALPRPSKTKQLSVICSGKNVTPDHRQRQAFVRYLSAELGNEIDVFGRDSRPVDDKADAIWNYKYHIVLENDHSAYYMTEKLTDAYLGWSYPLYAGGPEACLRFPSGSFTPIDIYQPEQSLSIIRRVIASNTYEQSLIQLEEARNAVLWKYNLFAMLAEYWDEFLGQQPAQLVQLVPKRFRGTLIARQLLRYFSSQHPAIHLKPKLLKATQPHSTQTQSTPTHV